MRSHFDAKDFLLLSHVKISKLIDAKIESCKSRSVAHDNFVIGTGGGEKAFVILTVEIMPGRSLEIRSELGKILSEDLEATLAGAGDFLDVQVSVHVKELSETYIVKKM